MESSQKMGMRVGGSGMQERLNVGVTVDGVQDRTREKKDPDVDAKTKSVLGS
jgi:hypothetical protein